MVRSVSLIVLCIFAKRFVLSVSGFLSQRNFCTTAVLLWGTHWGAVSWIVLFFSCRAIPRARLWAQRARLGKAQFGGRIALRGERIPRTRSGPVWGSDIDYSTHICLCAQRLSACLKRGLRIPQGRFSRVLLCHDKSSDVNFSITPTTLVRRGRIGTASSAIASRNSAELREADESGAG